MSAALIRRFVPVTALTMAFLLFAGCQTTDEHAEPYPRGASKIPFVPIARQVPIQAAEGAYPNLFTGASHAIWNPHLPAAEVPAPVTGASEDTEAMEATMETGVQPVAPPSVPRDLRIQCFLESEFPDMSIAYDAVGLRGMSVYLALPGGEEIVPAQKVLDTELGETPVGALRRYSRSLTLYFPAGYFMVENPAANPGAEGVRLVLEGHGTKFQFQWHATPDLLVKTEPRADYQVRESVKKHYRATKAKAKAVSHTFD